MQKDNKSNIPPVESLLSAKEKIHLSHIEDKLTHTWNLPALLLIGVDSRRLVDAFAAFIDSMSPLPIERYDIENPADASPLKNADQLEPALFHLFNFFNCRGISWDEVAANLIFYRDYIPQYRLKIVILASHDLLNTIIEKAYDFYSISGFTGFFRDFALAIESRWSVGIWTWDNPDRTSYAYLHTGVLPKLRVAGFTDAQIEKIMHDNPIEMLRRK